MSTNGSSATTLSVVIVTYRQGPEVRATLEALERELRDGDELIVVDNASGDGTADVVATSAPDATLIRSEHNAGFPAGCNLGARAATGKLLVFLNPDAVPAPDWREAIAAPSDAGRWDAWQALVTAEDGTRVNTRGGVVHFTGIAWAGGAGEPVPDDGIDTSPPGVAPASAEVAGASDRAGDAGASEPGFVSGACLAIRREAFERLGGFADRFFLYHEDVDLSLRMRLAGGRLGVATDARVDHDYEFDKGPAKWRYLERNRWATLIRTYPGALLAALAPALAATEVALLVASLLGGWSGQKLRAWGDTLAALPRLLRERRAIQATRAVSAAAFAGALTPTLDSAYLGRASRSGALAALLRGYWALVLRIL
jgi:GT2 family glycosyltransferase